MSMFFLTLSRRLFASGDLSLAACIGIAARVLNALARFVSIPLAIHLLSAEKYGLWLVIGSVVSWLALADFGIPGALQNQLVSLYASKKPQEAKQLVAYAIRFFIKVGAGAWVLGLALILLLPVDDMLKVPPSMANEFKIALGAALSIAAALFILRLGPSLAYSHQMPSAPSFAEIGGSTASLAALFIVVGIGCSNLSAMVLVTVAGQLLGGGLLLFWILRRGGYLPLARLTDECIPLRRALLGSGLFFFINMVGEIFIFNSLPLIISNGLGPRAVAVFAIPMVIFNNTVMLQAMVQRSVMPKLRHYTEDQQPRLARKLVVRTYVFSGAVGLAVAIFVVVGGALFVSWWTQGAVTMSPTMTWGLAAFILVASVDNPSAAILIALDGIKLRCILTLLFGFSQGLVAYFLLPSFGVDLLPGISAVILLFSAVIPGIIGLRYRIAKMLPVC